MKHFIAFLLSIIVAVGEAKQYYLQSNEVETSNAHYVYSLFGLSKIVNNPPINNLRPQQGISSLPPRPVQRPQGIISPTDVPALTNITMCYYLGNDVESSHLQFNEQWKFNPSNPAGLYAYINQLTLGANVLMGLQNFKLKWKGPYARVDKQNRYPQKIQEDVLLASQAGCDLVAFLVFNDFSSGTDTTGHRYSGFAVGGPCELGANSGYMVIVDQGFLGETWMGPQILAHHLLLMLTSDLHPPNDAKRYCPNPNSLLHQYIKAGEQVIDQCVIDKLNLSNISIRPCLLDS